MDNLPQNKTAKTVKESSQLKFSLNPYAAPYYPDGFNNQQVKQNSSVGTRDRKVSRNRGKDHSVNYSSDYQNKFDHASNTKNVSQTTHNGTKTDEKHNYFSKPNIRVSPNATAPDSYSEGLTKHHNYHNKHHYGKKTHEAVENDEKELPNEPALKESDESKVFSTKETPAADKTESNASQPNHYSRKHQHTKHWANKVSSKAEHATETEIEIEGGIVDNVVESLQRLNASEHGSKHYRRDNKRTKSRNQENKILATEPTLKAPPLDKLETVEASLKSTVIFVKKTDKPVENLTGNTATKSSTEETFLENGKKKTGTQTVERLSYATIVKMSKPNNLQTKNQPVKNASPESTEVTEEKPAVEVGKTTSKDAKPTQSSVASAKPIEPKIAAASSATRANVPKPEEISEKIQVEAEKRAAKETVTTQQKTIFRDVVSKSHKHEKAESKHPTIEKETGSKSSSKTHQTATFKKTHKAEKAVEAPNVEVEKHVEVKPEIVEVEKPREHVSAQPEAGKEKKQATRNRWADICRGDNSKTASKLSSTASSSMFIPGFRSTSSTTAHTAGADAATEQATSSVDLSFKRQKNMTNLKSKIEKHEQTPVAATSEKISLDKLISDKTILSSISKAPAEVANEKHIYDIDFLCSIRKNCESEEMFKPQNLPCYLFNLKSQMEKQKELIDAFDKIVEISEKFSPESLKKTLNKNSFSSAKSTETASACKPIVGAAFTELINAVSPVFQLDQNKEGRTFSDFSSTSDKTMIAKTKRLRALLNKMTPTTYDNIFVAIIEICEPTIEDARNVLELIFEKATTNHMHLSMYADLCSKLGIYFVEAGLFTNVPTEGKHRFNYFLTDMCENSFNRYILQPFNAPESLSENDAFEALLDFKKRMKGNLTFICLLAQTKRVRAKILLHIINDILRLKDPIQLEALAYFLPQCYEALLEKPKDKIYFESDIFPRIKAIADSEELPLRVQVLLTEPISNIEKLINAE